MAAELNPYPGYKDSGVEWLGAVPAHWEVRQLGRIGRFFKGGGGTKEDDAEHGVPCIRYGDLYTYHGFFITESRGYVAPETATAAYTPLRYGDVLFAGSGETIDEIGKSAVNMIPGRACCGGDVIVFRPAIEVEARFLGYVTDCRQAASQKACMGRGITVMHIYGSELKYMTAALPPVTEQVAIADFLDDADRRIRRYIRAKEKLVALLEEQKQSVIQQAVTGQIDVRTGKPYRAYKSSGIEWVGKVPAHWELLHLGRLITLTVGFPFKSDGFTQFANDTRLLRGVNITPGRIRWDDVARWPIDDVHPFSEYRLQEGDIVFGMDRPIVGDGIRVALMGQSDVPSLLLQRVARLRPGRRLLRDFVFQLLTGRSFSDYLAPIFTGISVPHVSPEQIKGFRVALPDVAEQQAIVGYLRSRIEALRAVMERTQDEIALFREYRTRLIADVVTGKVDVRGVATGLPEVDSVPAGDAVDEVGGSGASSDRKMRQAELEEASV